MFEELDAPMSDIRAGDWAERHAPAALLPYIRLARLDRPIGTWLLLFPGWWSVAMATEGRTPDWIMLALFAIGAVAMRGAGCTLNDLMDRDLDAQVARTRTRPLPSGQVTPFQAMVFMALQLVVGAVILFTFNGFAILVGLAVLALIATYPLMKRVTYWPQFFLGLNFNWGALLGWAAIRGELSAPALWLYAGGVAWTLGYDTIYAHQDKEDDARIGIKSSALRLGAATRPYLFVFYGVAAALWLIAGMAANLGWLYLIGLAFSTAQMAWQAARVDLDDPEDCLVKFRSNRWVGWLLLLGIVAAHAFDGV